MKTLAKMTAAVAITVASVFAQANQLETKLETVSVGTKVKIEKDIYLPWHQSAGSKWGGYTFAEGVLNGTNDNAPFCRIVFQGDENIFLKKGTVFQIIANDVLAADSGRLKMIEGKNNTILLKSKKGNYLALVCQLWTSYQPENSTIMARSSTINVAEFQRAFGNYLTLKMAKPKTY